MMEKASRHLDEYVEADVKVSTVDKLVGEESPNLFLLLRVENEWALVKENMHIISKLFCHLSKKYSNNQIPDCKNQQQLFEPVYKPDHWGRRLCLGWSVLAHGRQTLRSEQLLFIITNITLKKIIMVQMRT